MPSASFTLTDSQGNATTVSAPFTVSAPSALRFPGDPGLGNVYVGESRGTEPASGGFAAGIAGDPSDREKYWGAKVGVFRSYRLWGEWDKAVQFAQRDLAAGRLPIISMHTGSLGWASVASGAHDTEIKALFARFAALPGPVWFAWDHEPVDNPEQGTPAEFGAMNTHTMSLLPKNMALTPIVQSYPFDPAQNRNAVSVAPWYPPGSYTFVGVDLYNGHWYYPSPGGPAFRDAATSLSFITKVRKDLGSPDVPVIICETGVRTDPANPGKAAQWIHELVAQAKTMNIPAISYFDSGTNVFTGTSFALDDMGDGTKNTERLDAWGAEVKANAHL